MTYIPATYPQTLERNPADFTTPKQGLIARALDAFALPTVYVKALDVARYQEIAEVDYAKAYAAGYRLVIIKATEGTSYLDPMFGWHWQHALDAGFYGMFYHFFLDYQDGAAQADWFLDQTQKARDAFLGRVAAWNDIERRTGAPPVTVGVRRARAISWGLDVLKEIKRVGAYSSPALWNELMGNDTLTKYGDGWLAHWTSAKAPTIPPGWTDAATRIWQTGVYPTYPWVEPVPGVTGTVDVDRWLGDEKSLRDYLGYVDAPPTPPPADLEARVKALETDVLSLKASHNDVVDDLAELLRRVAALDSRTSALEARPAGSSPFAWFTPDGGSCVIQHASRWNRTSSGIDKPIFAPVGDGAHPKINGKARVFPLPLTGDGGQVCYMLLDQIIDGETVYVRRQDGKLA